MSLRITLMLPYTEKPYGGARAVAYNTVEGFRKIAKLLEKNDVHLTIVSTARDAVISKKDIHPNIEILHYKFPSFATFSGAFHSYKKNKYFFLSSDLVHAHDIYNAFASSQTGTKTIMTLHGLYWRDLKVDKFNVQKLFYYGWNTIQFMHAFHTLTKFVAISRYVQRELKRLGIYDEFKVVIIENPIRDNLFNIKRAERENLILYPAKIYPLKNQLTFIRAIGILRNQTKEDFKVIFAGKVVDALYYSQLLSEIKKLNLQKYIKFELYPYEKMPSVYAQCSITALTSYHENAPMTISESFAVGVPVIASNVGGIPYMVSHGKDGFIIQPNSPGDIAERLLILLEDRKLRKRMGKEAKKKAQERWRDRIIAKNLLNLYLQLGG
ncbi:MAG: glycosyltransferase family 4 protein [Thermococcus sp.]|uniref:glycosyltransferase family 4 protein n=1 Tax=Thermococcus sp. TaxID=35749 RepID=UPI001DD9BB2E|nr:glycosyltransferase family 4 protein [Thermococcus sp.]MBO8175160.1 glycosyltransferase family 4 protein [Thermococcus sp.]